MSIKNCECCGETGLAQLLDGRVLCCKHWKQWEIKKMEVVREALARFIAKRSADA